MDIAVKSVVGTQTLVDKTMKMEITSDNMDKIMELFGSNNISFQMNNSENSSLTLAISVSSESGKYYLTVVTK